MEQRGSQRCQVSLDVMLNYGSLGLVHGRVVNIGMGGMFVETGRIQLPVFASVEASLALDPDHPLASVQLDTVVVRSADRGVGLKFNELATSSRNSLQLLINQANSPTLSMDQLRLEPGGLH